MKNNKRQLVLGDPHGCYKGMLQCFERSNFDKEKDELIVLGDVCDGWSQVKECFDLLLECKNLIYVIGNHDKWALDWYTGAYIDGGLPDFWWTSQGGQATIDSYGGIKERMNPSHIAMIRGGHVAFEQSKNNRKQLFVHGGIDPNKKLENQDPEIVMWDRQLFESAHQKHYQKRKLKFGGYDDIFIGHTACQKKNKNNEPIPCHFCNVWNLDTGAGWSGVLTIMDAKTKKYWQSDDVEELYSDEKGRR